MTTLVDRASGLAFLLLGLASYFYVIPTYVETAEGGNIQPGTLPNLIAIVMTLCGAILIAKPTDQALPDSRCVTRAGLFALVIAIGVYAMSWFGFIIVAPVLAAVLMLLAGEKRKLWLGIGAIGVPMGIWFLVVLLLDRALP